MIDFFVRTVNAHKQVLDVTQMSTQVFEVARHIGPSPLLVFLSDFYTIGIADYYGIRAAAPEIKCIVTASGYNYYTSQAKLAALKDEIGLFKIGEFLGALHLKKLWTYEPPKKGDEVLPPRKRLR